ncbi:hypothetical protein PVS_28 [Vibrio phage vB_VspS_VS-ABTNL-3]|nr:hypothetical protein PVS_28 [Vibrio phage vB_VspS_VS-ABTNL-3]
MSDLIIDIFEVEFSPPYENFSSEKKFLDAIEPYTAFGVEAAEYKKDGYGSCAKYGTTTQMLSGYEVLEALSSGLKLEVKQKKGVKLRASEIFAMLGEKPTINVTRQEEIPNNFNSHCEVHMPGQALSFYNNTMLMEDACTDALQSELEQGWRIIAVCPQPDQRRPDYILGRFDPNVTNGSAERG